MVVFSEWERMQAMAAEACKRVGVGFMRLHGGVASSARGRLIDRFREDPECRVFLSTDAGGVGLNLQVASHVVNLDLPWNPAVLAQRIARVHRLGQREAVNVVLMVSEGSFEQRMEGTLDAKRALFAAAVGDDQDTKELERSSMARRIATLLSGEFAASTGAKPAAAPPDPVAALRAPVGPALAEVARLANGRLVGLVRGEEPADAIDGVVLLPTSAAAALGRLGAASPLASAEVLYRAPEATPTTDPGRRPPGRSPPWPSASGWRLRRWSQQGRPPRRCRSQGRDDIRLSLARSPGRPPGRSRPNSSRRSTRACCRRSS